MNRRTRVWAAATLLAVLPIAAACNGDDDAEPGVSPSPSSPSPSTPTESTAPDDAPPSTADDLVGTWRDDAADWTVHFASDGTFTVDFQGNVDFLTGTFTIADGVVTLSGLDGYDQVGQVTEDGLVFDLGTLTRR